MITIEVEVTGAVAPVEVNVTIASNEGYNHTFSNPTSFKKDFELESGDYTVIISGENNDDGTTEITITGKDNCGSSINKSYSSSEIRYNKIFRFEIC